MKNSPTLLNAIRIVGIGVLSLSIFSSLADAITLQIPPRPTAFPLVQADPQESGSLCVWGSTQFNQTNVPTGLTNVVQVAGALSYIMALKSDGTVVAWGNSNFDYGQTIIPDGLTNVVQIAAGRKHAVALRSDGTVVAWGDNSGGETTIPVGLINVVQVAAGYNHTVALKSDGTVVAWGTNNIEDTNIPSGLTNVVQIAAGAWHTVALNSDGTVTAWGNNAFGQMNIPAGLTNVVEVAAAADGFHTIALKSDGTVAAWGNWGILQIATNSPSTTPIGLTNVVQVADGGTHSLALRNDGSIISWGDNRDGNISVPKGLTNIFQIAACFGNSMALHIASNQTISPFVTIVNKTNRIAPFTIPVPKSTSGLPVKLSIISGPATIVGNKITVTGAGMVVLAANQSGNVKYASAPEITTSFSVLPAAQFINFPSIPPTTYSHYPFPPFPPKPLVLTAKASSGLPVTYSVISGAATVTKSMLIYQGAGTIVLAADQAGNTNYNPANQVVRTFKVNKSPQTIESPSQPGFPLIANKTTTNAPFTILAPYTSSSLPAIVTIKSGPAILTGEKITLTGKGTVILTANQPGDPNYLPAPEVTWSFLVKTNSLSTNSP